MDRGRATRDVRQLSRSTLCGPDMRAVRRDPQSFDHLVDCYDVIASVEHKPDFVLQHLPPRRQRALDIGCGTGILTLALAQSFDSVLGIDISKPMLAQARATRSAPNVHYQWGDANDLAVGGTFDLIVSHTTFHHLDDVGAVLRRIREQVTPGGRVIVADLVKGRLPLHPVVLFLEALALLPVDLFRIGSRGGVRLFRRRVSRPWLEHLNSDRLLTSAEFRATFARELPGARFLEIKPFEAVVWEAPGG